MQNAKYRTTKGRNAMSEEPRKRLERLLTEVAALSIAAAVDNLTLSPTELFTRLRSEAVACLADDVIGRATKQLPPANESTFAELVRAIVDADRMPDGKSPRIRDRFKSFGEINMLFDVYKTAFVAPHSDSQTLQTLVALAGVCQLAAEDVFSNALQREGE